MQEHETQDGSFLARLARRRGRYHDALGVNHLPHHAAGAVGGRHQDCRLVRAQRQHVVGDELLGGDLLKTPEQGVGRGVRSRQGHAHPAEQGGEQRVDSPGAGEGQPQRGVHAAVARGEGDGQHAGDREQGPAHPVTRGQEQPHHAARRNPHPRHRHQRRQEDAGAGGGQPVELEDGRLGFTLQGHGGTAGDLAVQAGRLQAHQAWPDPPVVGLFLELGALLPRRRPEQRLDIL